MSVNPFEIRNLLSAKHAQHVLLIHFPIGLFLAGVAFDFLSEWRKSRELEAVAYWNLVGAALSILPVMASGLGAWQWALGGQKLKGILKAHLLLGCISSVLVWATFWIHKRARRDAGGMLPVYRLPIEGIAVIMIGLTAHLGGFLSGVNGPA